MSSHIACENKKLAILLLFLVVASLALTGCAGGPNKGLKPSADWSRSIALGKNVAGSPSLALEERTGIISLVWPQHVDSTVGVNFMRLSRDSTILVERQLTLPTSWPRSTRLLPAEGGQNHLLWTHRDNAEAAWYIWHALLDAQGEIIRGPASLTSDLTDVGSFSLASDHAGGAYVFWDTGEAGGGLTAIHLSATGEPDTKITTISNSGVQPTIRLDPSGDLHAAWIDGIDLRYAVFPNGELQATTGTVVSEVKLGIGDNLMGPTMGISGQWVHIFWSVLSRSGLEAGDEKTRYVAFSNGSPRKNQPSEVYLYPVEDQVYAPFEGTLPLTELASPASPVTGSENTGQPATVDQDLGELPVALTFMQNYRLDSLMQIGVGLFENGRFVGYQVASKTLTYSSSPVMAADPDGYLYLAWREGAKGDQIYFSTTSPPAVVVLDKISLDGILNTALRGSLEGFVGLAFFPFAFFWLVPGIIILGIMELTTGQDSLTRPLSIVLLILSMLSYETMKVIILPTILDYVPFSAWLDIPTALRLPLRIAVPLLSMALGILVASVIRRRRSSDSSLLFFFTACGIDGLLTLFIYGVNLLGAF